MSIQQQLGKKLEIIRKERKFSQDKFAYFLEMERGQYWRIEKGKTNTSVATLYSISSKLEMTLEELFKGVETIEIANEKKHRKK